jgi:hypothetical protein
MQHNSLYVIVLLLLYAPVVSHTEIVFVAGHALLLLLLMPDIVC